ncbi:hypothetical protein [Clostridioides sp. GD02404]|uniref:hypothetical protein n=1 Tax=Clostridioides sp. GD02404 TaxID=3054354 RepID=UPI003301075D
MIFNIVILILCFDAVFSIRNNIRLRKSIKLIEEDVKEINSFKNSLYKSANSSLNIAVRINRVFNDATKTVENTKKIENECQKIYEQLKKDI